MAERQNLSLVQVTARRGRWEAVGAAAEKAFGAAPPARPGAVFAGGVALVWSGPEQFLVVGSGDGLHDPLAPLGDAFGNAASLFDQSDGRALIRLSGSRVRDALAKVCSLDLHPAAFPVGAAAATSMDHANVSLWRLPDESGAPVFHLLAFRSFAEGLWHGLETAGAEYGVEVAGAAPG